MCYVIRKIVKTSVWVIIMNNLLFRNNKFVALWNIHINICKISLHINYFCTTIIKATSWQSGAHAGRCPMGRVFKSSSVHVCLTFCKSDAEKLKRKEKHVMVRVAEELKTRHVSEMNERWTRVLEGRSFNI